MSASSGWRQPLPSESSSHSRMKKVPQFLAYLLSFALCGASVQGAVKYWDINGTTAGSGGATPGGTWSTGVANWNSDSAGGAGTLSVWTSGTADAAVFSAV